MKRLLSIVAALTFTSPVLANPLPQIKDFGQIRQQLLNDGWIPIQRTPEDKKSGYGRTDPRINNLWNRGYLEAIIGDNEGNLICTYWYGKYTGESLHVLALPHPSFRYLSSVLSEDPKEQVVFSLEYKPKAPSR